MNFLSRLINICCQKTIQIRTLFRITVRGKTDLKIVLRYQLKFYFSRYDSICIMEILVQLGRDIETVSCGSGYFLIRDKELNVAFVDSFR